MPPSRSRRRARSTVSPHFSPLAPSSSAFTTGLVAFLKRAIEHALGEFQLAFKGLSDRFDTFRDVMVTDSTVIKLHLMRGLGTRAAESSDFLSMLIFQEDYLARLIALGGEDARARGSEIVRFVTGE